MKITSDEKSASAGNRTPINCLEGNYANHYTTDASASWGSHEIQYSVESENKRTSEGNWTPVNFMESHYA